MVTRRHFVVGAATLALARQAAAQPAWPSRPITLIMPFAAGGGSDFVSRVVMQRLSVRLGQPITVDNRGGAGGNIGFAAGARAAPDGHTLTTVTQNITVNPHMYRDMPFDPVRDFQPVTIMTEVGSVLVVNSRVPATNLRELIDYARANPRAITGGNGGIGGQALRALRPLRHQSTTFNSNARLGHGAVAVMARCQALQPVLRPFFRDIMAQPKHGEASQFHLQGNLALHDKPLRIARKPHLMRANLSALAQHAKAHRAGGGEGAGGQQQAGQGERGTTRYHPRLLSVERPPSTAMIWPVIQPD